MKNLQQLEKGQTISIDRWQNGQLEFYTIKRFCRRHINMIDGKSKWAMPLDRVKDIVSVDGVTFNPQPK